MIVRRIRDHVAHHNWFAVVIDLAIVVVGVFLGTQANNWNEARVERALAQSYRARLVEDLRATERGMDASARYYADVRRHAVSALAALDRPPATLGAPFLVDAYQATQVFPRLAKHSTYDEILASGKAELLGQPALRTRVSNYYWRMDGLMTLVTTSVPYRERLRSVMPYAVQVAIRAQCDEVITIDLSGLATARLPDHCSVGIDPALATGAVTAITADPGMRQGLNRALIDLDVKLQQFARLKAGAVELRAYLEAAAH